MVKVIINDIYIVIINDIYTVIINYTDIVGPSNYHRIYSIHLQTRYPQYIYLMMVGTYIDILTQPRVKMS